MRCLIGVPASCVAESQDTGSSTTSSSRMVAQDLNEYAISSIVWLTC